MIGIPLGLLTANAVECVTHKYVLHGMGRNSNSFWRFHWHEHHREVRRNEFHDPAYNRSPLGLHAQGKEVASLVAGAVVVIPMLPVAPFFVGTLYYCAGNYYRVHRKSHLDPEWGRNTCRGITITTWGQIPMLTGVSPARGLTT